MGNLLFQRLTEGTLDEVLSWDPALATQLGWTKYDDILRDPSDEALAAQVGRLRKMIEEFSAFREDHLSPDELIDRDLAVHLFRLKVFEMEELRIHERMATATEDIGNALFLLFHRDFVPFEKRLDSIASRLEKVPEFLERSKPIVKSPCRMWNEMALGTGRSLGGFLDQIRDHAFEMLGRNPRTCRLSSAVDNAKEAIESYNLWLETTVIPNASGDARVTPELFEEYMRLKGLDIAPDEALKVAEVHLARTRAGILSVAAKMTPSGSVQDAMRLMKTNHPEDFDEVIKVYRRDIMRAREFLLSKDLVTIPSDERLIVAETPAFMRHTTPYAAQYEPAKFSNDRTGIFFVTPGEDPEMLKDHSYALIANTAVHEGYPGHHLQGVCGNTHPSYMRVLSASMDFAEGWALYCEELMLQQGFGDTAEGRLAQLNDLAFRIVRVIADIGMARGEMTPEDVADMLAKEAGLHREGALNDARTYTCGPTLYLSYFIGKMAILQLLDDVRRAMGDRFSLKFFHDTLLYSGCMPIHFARREMATRLREEYGIDLGEPRERLYDFAMRLAGPGTG